MITGMRILLVEDSDLQREVAKGLLEEIGFGRVIEAKDGVEALQVLQKRTIDLILSDWEMPEMDGLELLKKVRSTKEYEHIPFIILTANDQKDYILQAVRAGVTDYIIKPMERDILKTKLNKLSEDK